MDQHMAGVRSSVADLPPPLLQEQRPRTRLQQGIRKPKKYTDDTIWYVLFTSTREPSKLLEALGDDRWCKAMQEEYDALIENKTWHLVPPDSTKNLIDCKWVYRIKKHADDTSYRYKALSLQKASNSDMELIMRIPLVQLSNQLLSELCWQLLFIEDGFCGN
jgi:hypothetical protein